MTFTIRPDLERELEHRVKSGPYQSADDLINAALEQFMAPEFAPGELNELLAVGERQIASGQVVSAEEVVRQMHEMKSAWRRGK